MTKVKLAVEAENHSFKQQITSGEDRYQQATSRINSLNTQLAEQTDKNALLIIEVQSLKSTANAQKDIIDRWFIELKGADSQNRSISKDNN